MGGMAWNGVGEEVSHQCIKFDSSCMVSLITLTKRPWMKDSVWPSTIPNLAGGICFVSANYGDVGSS